MKTSILCLALASSLLASASTRAEIFQISAGAVCQPATTADASRLDYSLGSARNITLPGSSGQMATVVCALPAVAPLHVMVRASAYLHDPERRWPRAKCSFLNVSPGSAARWAPIQPLSPTSPIGSATLVVDPFFFVPQAVSCSVHPGQALYAVETEVELLG